mmetsp:Transcript_8009/g.23683  ORF Transcript_8009/g.23683 Transcript_8009/m.23683 type:complete len:315 (+) Transcript_8009:241-1185(+)
MTDRRAGVVAAPMGPPAPSHSDSTATRGRAHSSSNSSSSTLREATWVCSGRVARPGGVGQRLREGTAPALVGVAGMAAMVGVAMMTGSSFSKRAAPAAGATTASSSSGVGSTIAVVVAVEASMALGAHMTMVRDLAVVITTTEEPIKGASLAGTVRRGGGTRILLAGALPSWVAPLCWGHPSPPAALRCWGLLPEACPKMCLPRSRSRALLRTRTTAPPSMQSWIGSPLRRNSVKSRRRKRRRLRRGQLLRRVKPNWLPSLRQKQPRPHERLSLLRSSGARRQRHVLLRWQPKRQQRLRRRPAGLQLRRPSWRS